MISVVR